MLDAFKICELVFTFTTEKILVALKVCCKNSCAADSNVKVSDELSNVLRLCTFRPALTDFVIVYLLGNMEGLELFLILVSFKNTEEVLEGADVSTFISSSVCPGLGDNTGNKVGRTDGSPVRSEGSFVVDIEGARLSFTVGACVGFDEGADDRNVEGKKVGSAVKTSDGVADGYAFGSVDGPIDG